MNMKTRRIILSVLFTIALYLSLIFDQILQIVLAIALPIIVAYLFLKLNNKNIKLYFIIVTIVLLLLTALNLIFTQIYDWTYLLPLFGGLILTQMNADHLKYWILMKESIALLNEGKYHESLYYLDKLLESGFNYFSVLHSKAAVLSKMEKYQESLDLTNKILKKDKKNVLVLGLRAGIFIKLERYDAALEHIDIILKKEPQFGPALANKAVVLFKQGDYQKAVTYFEDALGKIPTKDKWKFKGLKPIKLVFQPRELAELWFGKGKAHQKLQQYNEALECFDKALKLKPYYKDALKSKEEVLKFIKN
ncbi:MULTISPECIES: tetratricopeptide repeat protein [Methanobacterium]|uniref:Tetratricopeptide repeat protein n=1 Tax=Methanobacterium veterum TaxID=408577 RepID=A0A9E5DHX0_9EURY|nr:MULTISPECIES: tetratricopeptide repeat protein [Methanobacterium]MCZ3364572.1 tetratricopeptide repeat protein [Methanobacterium veterum]MCZ3372326.1 tetratricopeptide repeat protein [Methanobacterium veterum]